MASADEEPLFFSRCTSLCEREKKEVSAPETRAETHSSNSDTTQRTTTGPVKPLNRIQWDERSKLAAN